MMPLIALHLIIRWLCVLALLILLMRCIGEEIPSEESFDTNYGITVNELETEIFDRL